jgi:hypothetical protein
MQRINVLTVLGLLVLTTVTYAQTQPVWTSPLVEGQCTNGDTYKLQSYRQDQDGRQVNGYAYEGPLGQGTVLSSVALDQAKRHVCKESVLSRWLPDDGDDQ